MSDLISREEAIKINENHHGEMPNHINHQIWKELNSIPPISILDHARAIKEYCEKHRNEHNFYMCETCEYAISTYSGYLQERTHKCPFNVPAHWDLPKGEKGGEE